MVNTACFKNLEQFENSMIQATLVVKNVFTEMIEIKENFIPMNQKWIIKKITFST